MPKTLPEQIDELTLRVSSIEADKASLSTKLAELEKARAEETALHTKSFAEKEAALQIANAAVTATKAELVDVTAKFSAASAEVLKLKGEAKTAEARAVEIMAGVGQGQRSAPFQASDKGAAKTITEQCIEAREAAASRR